MGEHVRRLDGRWGVVEQLTIEARPVVMYNLTVARAHTFFVGDAGWLVHNSCDSVGDALANTAGKAHRGLQKAGLGESTVAAGRSANGQITLSVFHSTAEGTEAAVNLLRKKWTVLDAPKMRSVDFHAERQLADAGFTKIGISNQGGMCPACKEYFANRPDIQVYPYKGYR